LQVEIKSPSTAYAVQNPFPNAQLSRWNGLNYLRPICTMVSF